KFATSADGSTGEIKVANTKINEWEELTFDFSSKISETNDQIIIFPDFQARTTDNVCYFDNITFSATTSAPKEPTVAAATPTALEANVISLFSNAYTNKTVDTWRTPWSAATLTDVQVAGNDVKKYSGLDFVGVETVGANLIDATTMEFFNIDVWTPNATTFKIKLVDFGADAAYAGGDDKEHELSFTPTQETWNTYKIALTDFTGLTTRAHMAQYIFVGVPTGTTIAYIDNVYFSKAANTSVNSIEASKVSVYPNPANSVFTVTSANVIENITVVNALGQSVYTAAPGTNGVSVDASAFAKGIYTVLVSSNGQTTASKVAVN
ncbi:MAG: T9SS type A sorting domain-containing protein, partial [Chitinophagaceae bacterium]